MFRLSQNRMSMLITILFHSLLIIIFGMIKFDFSIKLPEYVDLVISSGLLRIENADVPKQPSENKVAAGKPENSVNRQLLDQVLKKESNVPVDLPKRLTNRQEMTTKKFDEKKNETEINPLKTVKNDITLPDDTGIKDVLEYKGTDSKAEREIGDKGDLTEALPSSNIGRGSSDLRSFSIEWFGTEREKYSGELPGFPEGVTTGGTIKIRFYVKPDGTVGRMIPEVKADSRFENSALKALKNWKFSKLDSQAPQVEQQGVITFVFKLK